jgi:hypothetical protein
MEKGKPSVIHPGAPEADAVARARAAWGAAHAACDRAASAPLWHRLCMVGIIGWVVAVWVLWR